MPRIIRNTLILAKLEPTYGTDSVPVGGTDALLVSDPSINPLVANNVARNFVRGYLGGSEQLVGTNYVEVSFTVEAAGSGTATTPPAWGKLLQACGFGQTVGAASVDYLPVSTFGTNTSLTIYYFLDGQLHKLLGARGTWELAMGVGERPEFRFRFIGKNGGLTAVANPAPTLTAWRTPQVVTDTNSADLALGGVTYTAGTGVISGGTGFTSKGLQVSSGNNLVFQPLVGAETVELTDRQITGTLSLDLSAAQAVSAMTDVLANTTTGLGFTHGTTTGNILGVFSPVVQRISPSVEDLNGNALHAYQLRMVPSAGNDELRIVAR